MRTLALSLGLAAFFVAGAQSAWAADPPPPASAPQQQPPPPSMPGAYEVVGQGRSGCCDACLPRCRRLTLEGHAAMILDEPEGPPGLVSSGQPNAVDWNVLDYGVAFGGRAAFETHAFGSWVARVEGTWWGTWDDSDTVTGTLGATTTPGGAVNPSPTFAVGLESEATLWDAQVSFWRPLTANPCSCWAWGWGVRYTSFNEESTHTFPGIGAAPVTVILTGEADNTLFAAQLAVRAGWCLNECWSLTLDLAGFAGWRHTEREVRVTNIAATGGTAEDDDFGFGFEAQVAARWKLSSSLSLRFGAGALGLFDQARGYQLVDFTHTGNANFGPAESEEFVLAYRAFAGIEWDL
jgi:hypothetical protein